MPKIAFVFLILLTFGNAKPIYVNTTTIKNGTLQRQEVFVGTIAFKEISNIASQTQGVVQKIYFHIGQKVKKGQRLLKLNEDLLLKDIQIKKAKLTQAQYALQRQKKDLERYKNLLDSQSIPLQEYENLEYELKSQEANILALQAELEISQTELAKKTIYAPFDGVIVEQKVHIAEWVNTGEGVCQILNNSNVEAIIDVPSSIAKNIQAGQKVNLTINNKHYQGKIAALIPKVDVRSRTFPVYISVKNDGSFLDGMAVEAMLNIDGKSSGFIVPRDSVVYYLGQPSIFVVKNNQAYVVKVEVLSVQNSLSLVRGKISEGDKVVYRGQDRLQNGSLVEEKTSGKK